MNSLKVRLFLASTFVLLGFIVLTGLGLERAFRNSAQQAEEDKLKGLVYAILGAMDIGEEGELMVDEGVLGELALSQPASGLAGFLADNRGNLLWRSTSLLQRPLPSKEPIGIGEWVFERRQNENRSDFHLAYGVQWSSDNQVESKFVVAVQEDSDSFDRQVVRFRKTLVGWLGLAAGALLIVQMVLVRWGLVPLRKVAEELAEIQQGKREKITGAYIKELNPLISGLNSFLRHEHGQQKRYRNALDDLAHSLKTPLAVLKGLSEQSKLPQEDRGRLEEQVENMDQIVGYQLRKAATVGRQAFTKPIAPRKIVDQVVSAVSKVYRDKNIRYDIDLSVDLEVRFDEGDMMEILGNVLDNASKWCKSSVTVQGKAEDVHFVLRVDDDGPGFPDGHAVDVFERGVRADSQREGQGIGLAVVQEIVSVYGGSIRLADSPLGGGRVEITLQNS